MDVITPVSGYISPYLKLVFGAQYVERAIFADSLSMGGIQFSPQQSCKGKEHDGHSFRNKHPLHEIVCSFRFH